MTDDPTPPEAPARFPLYGPEYTESPGSVYAAMRAHGGVAPVELLPGVPATLIIGYEEALEVMRDPGRFPRDASRWERKMDPGCPLLPMMGFRRNTMSVNGAVHARLRSAITDSLDRVDVAALRRLVETTADALVSDFTADGEADLVGQYSRPLPMLVFAELFGCPPDLAGRFVRDMRDIFDGTNVQEADQRLHQTVRELLEFKRARPGGDLTSWMIAHPAGLDESELIEQIVLMFGAGSEPQQSLIANGVRLLLSDERFAGDLSGGSLPVEDALDEILWSDPPVANFGSTYPRQDLDFRGHRLPADEPVVVSYAAANTDPTRAVAQRAGNRAHLAFAAGPHTCPAKGHARLIASVAIETLLDRLPDMELAVPAEELRWRPGPFHRALIALPVKFPPQH
ncbi:cytochrome P450 [Actinomadura roseirufa]|uniref:cytochrome P450 n=1 Tax=Actinomadura roseirufa TaxID=2094049 RepID=UPI0010410775|nr:cytochrome P450 [Actinomadura roseirufa]